ncbi:MAG: ferredoxin [Gammaproteobacteria bacterium]|nr:MAG: ferredoxin [Gammaproteobacteria bacterium]
MSLEIVDSCVNCWACVDVCPSEAIYESKPHILINAKKCTECEGDYAEPQCASICPIEEAILSASGEPMNPLGSLTGIPPEKIEEARMEIQAR